MREISILEDRVETLQTQLEQERQEKAELQIELTNTKEQLGELRGKLSSIELERQPAAYWVRLLIIAMSGMLIIVGLAVVFLAGRVG